VIGALGIDLQQIDRVDTSVGTEGIPRGEWQHGLLDRPAASRPAQPGDGRAAWVDEEGTVTDRIGQPNCDDLRPFSEDGQTIAQRAATSGIGSNEVTIAEGMARSTASDQSPVDDARKLRVCDGRKVNSLMFVRDASCRADRFRL
ncbi:MAG: hypothetical protein WCC60_23150, partial [Ilumatobacteraceae bacterium]